MHLSVNSKSSRVATSKLGTLNIVHTSNSESFKSAKSTQTEKLSEREKENLRLRNMTGETVGQKIGVREEMITKACSLAMKAHESSSGKAYFCWKSQSHESETIFAFSGAWEFGDWYTHKQFGETKINPSLFPSLKIIGSDESAMVNKAFLQRFEAILENSALKDEVEKTAIQQKQIIFTGHSSAAPMAIFATLWFLEIRNQRIPNQMPPRCLTFGSPLMGDRIVTHALERERWSSCFTHFIARYDIVPRIFLSPLSSTERALQQILQYFNPKSPFSKSDVTAKSAEALMFFLTVMRNASAVTSHAACKYMGSTNLLLENVANFIELSPYRTFGKYVFCSGNGKLVVVRNPDTVLQLLFYSLQLESPREWAEIAQRSFKDHMAYESEVLESLAKQNVAYLDHLEQLPLSANYTGVDTAVSAALNDFGLSATARLCLQAAGELKRQRFQTQSKINSNKSKIEDLLNALEIYQSDCEVRQVGYYDAFKFQKHTEDFKSNIRRLELAGIWDEIIEMLKRYELPDEFVSMKEWIELGTRYRRLVEPLDIANYYRHSLNEDTGPYMVQARPARYRFTQKWREHAEKMNPEPIPESCFWAEVEELRRSTSTEEDFESAKERILQLERNVSRWVPKRMLGKDVFLKESTFVQWWKRLPVKHKEVSCVKDLLHE